MLKIERRHHGLLRVASMEDELDLDLSAPQIILDSIGHGHQTKADIFTFIQRMPDLIPRFPYHQEWESLAVLEYRDHHHWFNEIIDFRCRNKIRKGDKKGVVIRNVDFDDDLIHQIQQIYNESPIRQNRKFPHYQQSLEEIRAANGTHMDRSEFIGAYFEGELIGFIKLVYGDRSARTEQIISKIGHRDKAPTNALISRAIELSERKGLPLVIYGVWSEGTLGEFKRANGFRKVDVPRYYVPITLKGAAAIRLGLHRDLKARVPTNVRSALVRLRARWRRARSGTEHKPPVAS